jgi:hypothetical protein
MVLSVAAQINDCDRKLAKEKFARKSSVKWNLLSNMAAKHSIPIFEAWSLKTCQFDSTYLAVGEDEYSREILDRRCWDSYILIRQDFAASEVMWRWENDCGGGGGVSEGKTENVLP